jgi:hypothetical protein
MGAFNELLLILHFIGLGAGVASSVGNFSLMMTVAKSPPQDAPILMRVQPLLSRAGDIALALLWITGLIMVFTRWGGFGNLPMAFWWKFLFVILLTATTGLIHMTLARVRRGDTAARARLPIFGGVGAGFLLLIIVFAVVAFD